jgi:hypothetical protein
MVPSDQCRIDDLPLPFDPGASTRAALDLQPGWVRRWSTCWQVAGEEVVVPVGHLGSAPLAVCEPVRRFGWHPRQRHRPGLQFLVSTGRHHGFESLAEQRLLLALDFAGAARVVPQPFRLRFATSDGRRDHTPDFLGVLRDGSTWLVDVRPQDRVDEPARVCFAATAETALAAGWRYLVVTRWRGQVLATLDALSAQRRPLEDRLGLQGQLLRGVEAGPRTFGGLVAATTLPAVARAHALHLLWHRRLGVDLAGPFGDRYAYACMRGDGTRLGVVPRVWPMSWGLLGSQ